MASEDYMEARKRGLRYCKRCETRGMYPYLPALEDYVPTDKLAGERDLGVIQIPADFIVGTRTRGRTNAFAGNFMPLLETGTEFAAKWSSLCASHLEEGIRDPIRAYEYMNRYYVEEGNKRVSVLKYFGAVNVPGHVIRVLPQENGSREQQLYRELLGFSALSGITIAEFSRPGSYAELQAQVGKGQEERWTPQERARFISLFTRFRPLFNACAAEQPDSTAADGLLALIRIYGYEALCNMQEKELKAALEKAWEEIALLRTEDTAQLQLAPEKERKEGVLDRILSSGPRGPLKAAFLYDTSPAVSGWALGHETGRAYVQKQFGGEVETAAVFDIPDDGMDDALEQAVADGNRILFTTTPRLLPASLRCAVKHPEVTVFNCSLNASHRYIRTYYARMYEAKFLMGAIAGALAGNEPVGYISNYPIRGQFACINAFALGLQMVNPRSHVELEWSGVDSPEAARKRLTDRGIRLISSLDMPVRGNLNKGAYGLYLTGSGEDVQLARPVWDWGVYYEGLLRRYRSRSLQQEYKNAEGALNYYWGMPAGVIRVICSEKVPDGTRRLADILSRSIVTGQCNPFRGRLYAADGSRHGSAETTLSAEEIISMDWLNENVVGTIPAYEELTPAGKGAVDQMGAGKTMPAAAERNPAL